MLPDIRSVLILKKMIECYPETASPIKPPAVRSLPARRQGRQVFQ
jgi:hypothetical protein